MGKRKKNWQSNEGQGNRARPDMKNIRIRMYRVGFGDCFLLSLPISNGRNTDRDVHILVDCGVHSRGDIGTMEKVVNNIAKVTEKRLDVIIATHAHQDHISGFGRFGDLFTEFKIGEIWLPWTWDETNEEAKKIQRRQATLLAQLSQYLEVPGVSADQKAKEALENLNGNQYAIGLLKSGFGDSTTKVRYLKAGNTLKPEDTSISDLFVHILGPPDSEQFLAKMDPPGGQRYLRMLEGQLKVENDLQPFEQRFRVNPDDLQLYNIRLNENEEEELQQLAKYPFNELAFTLDQARNNESVVSLFVYRNQHLLFAGDAQYGNWRSWLDKEDSDDILSKINFFKVAHHGSVNATPKDALEHMSDGKFAAMVSTQTKPWDSIPRAPLMARLNEKTNRHLVRSDWLHINDAPEPTADAEPIPLPQGFFKGELWFDYMIEFS